MKRHIVLGCAAVIACMMVWLSSPHLQAKSQARHALSPEVQASVGRANRLLKEGQQARRAGDLETAEADLQECVKEHTSAGAFALEELARLYETEGRTNEAIHAYHDMIYPPDGVPPGTFGSASNIIHYATLLNDAGHWSEAVQAYKDILKSPDMPYNQEPPAADEPGLDTHFNSAVPQPRAMRAMLHVVLGRRYGRNYREALPQFDQAVAIDPNLAIAHYYRGYALHGLGHLTEAQNAFAITAKIGKGPVRSAATAQLRTAR